VLVSAVDRAYRFLDAQVLDAATRESWFARVLPRGLELPLAGYHLYFTDGTSSFLSWPRSTAWTSLAG
jgi:hypothetical protein